MDVIKEIYTEVDEDNAQLVSKEIDSNIQSIMMDLGNKLSPELSQEVTSVYNLNAKFAFYNVCFSKAHEILGKVDPKLASVFNMIQETNVYVVSRFTNKLLSLHPTITDLIQRLEEVDQDKQRPGGRGAADEENEELKKEIERLRGEKEVLMDRLHRQTREAKEGRTESEREREGERTKRAEQPEGRVVSKGHTFEESREPKRSSRK